MLALEEGDEPTAVRIGEELLASTEEADQVSGHLCLGYVYEDRGGRQRRDLGRALGCYRRLSMLAPGPLPFLLQARVCMKIGGEEGFRRALGYLEEARRVGHVPLYFLGLAHYFRIGPQRDLTEAKKLYLRAATHGRFAGFFGYSETAREMNQYLRALAMDCLRLVLGPFVALLIGFRAQESFLDRTSDSNPVEA